MPMHTATSYASWFEQITGHPPHAWQEVLGSAETCASRLIRIPTGMGKTLGGLCAWIYNRLVRQDPGWPLRLVWCLPMRVLAEQTRGEAQALLEALDLLWPGEPAPHQGRVGLHLLMGGEDDGPWRLHPEHPAILVGTQDMLLSRALNRGYGSARARWPMEYAMLHNQALWVMDEVQLMDVGLATSAQLQAFAGPGRHTWWMSATLREDWLETRDFQKNLPALRSSQLRVPADQRRGPLFSARKPCVLEDLPLGKEDKKRDHPLAARILALHQESGDQGHGRVTLAIVNTVDRARALHAALSWQCADLDTPPELRLIHSRFRGMEREAWTRDFLHRRHCAPGANRIIVATQVVEAGVDITATALVTELAPWPSLVQRFGRAARYGGQARVLVVDRALTGKDALPYDGEALAAARQVLKNLDDAGLASLEELEERLDPADLAALYPYEPAHLLSRREHEELFDTGVDLTGGDLDISRYIRSGEERDVSVFWAAWEEDPPPADLRPLRRGLCALPLAVFRGWLKKLRNNGHRAWTWDYLDNAWRPLEEDALYPGLNILVPTAAGGYDPALGFTGEKPKKKDLPLEWEDGVRGARDVHDADLGQDREDLSSPPEGVFVTIATHGQEAAREASALCQALGLEPELSRLLDLAARVHDWGKAHPAFASNIQDGPVPDLAKAPDRCWKAPGQLYRDEGAGPRPGFRHELATACALLELLRRHDPWHPALLGGLRAYVEAGVLPGPEPPDLADHGLARELAALDAGDFDLVAYLACAHHGKVRASWQATPRDQEFNASGVMGQGQPLRGLRDGDTLPPCRLALEDGQTAMTPELELSLEPAALGLSPRYGRSWNDRCQALLERFGPHRLALMETLVRVADARASALNTPDPLLEGERP